jgi:HEAT repeat protein
VRHAVPLLRAALEDENPEVRQAAKEVLERMGNPEIRIPKSEK